MKIRVPAASFGLCYPPAGIRRYVNRLGVDSAKRILVHYPRLEGLYARSLGRLSTFDRLRIEALRVEAAGQYPDEVADAFGGRLAVVDCVAARIVALRQLEGHNIGGLAASPDGRELLLRNFRMHYEYMEFSRMCTDRL